LLEFATTTKRLGATFVDLHTALMGPGVNLRAALSDGLHLGRQGAAVLLSLLAPVIHKKLGTSPESPLQMPLWRDLDNSDVAKSYKKWQTT